MKKLFITTLFLLGFIVSNYAQNASVAILKKDKSTFAQTETTSTTHFELKCTNQELEVIKSKAKELSGKLDLKTEVKGKNLYSCVLHIHHQNHPEYVQKMMLFLGFKSFDFDGKNRPIMELSDVLKSLK